MDVPMWVWFATIGAMIAILVVDLAIVDHPWSKKSGPKEFGMKQAAWWAAFYIGIAILFGFGLWYFGGGTVAGEYFAGFVTEKSLSVDNLFVFYLIMGSFAVPKKYQHEVLLVGIVIALVMRGIFIAIGAQAINAWSEVFYLFGAFLIYTAIKIVRDQVKGDSHEESDYTDSFAVRMVKKVWPVTDDYHGARLTVKLDGRRHVTPMLMVIVAIGVTDLVFAVDSIPAIFGLTQDPYIVFTANAFALLGLRQLYFLLAGLMDKLSYISWGLAAIMVFIGIKMFLHALHENGVHVPEVTTGLSLTVILGIMTITIVASLWKASADKKKLAAGSETEGEDAISRK
ncbi:TerC family protein [Marinactinospora thermotolerans]|uniref:Tellurite resistance protein TerC n=1 Tax=Marinactinospora thermotolerans DSM 45154 TaxID=1122192 RepID=A0A1T4S1J3_9ACTN|nr:TerC family protein [Marinactinospora thermotolerans]SKA22037.1 tellurite resistance protein TerC [Marinactinospora thermotolerans DSM 45154]